MDSAGTIRMRNAWKYPRSNRALPSESTRPKWERTPTPALSCLEFVLFPWITMNMNELSRNGGNQPRDRSGVLRGRKSTELQFHLRSAKACRQAWLADWPASHTESIIAGCWRQILTCSLVNSFWRTADQQVDLTSLLDRLELSEVQFQDPISQCLCKPLINRPQMYLHKKKIKTAFYFYMFCNWRKWNTNLHPVDGDC